MIEVCAFEDGEQVFHSHRDGGVLNKLMWRSNTSGVSPSSPRMKPPMTSKPFSCKVWTAWSGYSGSSLRTFCFFLVAMRLQGLASQYPRILR